MCLPTPWGLNCVAEVYWYSRTNCQGTWCASCSGEGNERDHRGAQDRGLNIACFPGAGSLRGSAGRRKNPSAVLLSLGGAFSTAVRACRRQQQGFGACRGSSLPAPGLEVRAAGLMQLGTAFKSPARWPEQSFLPSFPPLLLKMLLPGCCLCWQMRMDIKVYSGPP